MGFENAIPESMINVIVFIFVGSSFFYPPIQINCHTYDPPKSTSAYDNKLISRTDKLYIINRLSALFPDYRFFRSLSKVLYVIIVFFELIVAAVIKVICQYGSFFALIYLILFSGGGIYFLIENVYPDIPQEFGGPKPRCAQLDITTAHISNETLNAILPIDEMGSDSQVIRSKKVDVFFSGNEFIMIKPLMEKRGGTSEVFEIRKSNIEAIYWCDS